MTAALFLDALARSPPPLAIFGSIRLTGGTFPVLDGRRNCPKCESTMQFNPNPDAIPEADRFREVAQLLGTALHRWHKLRGDKRTRAIVVDELHEHVAEAERTIGRSSSR